MRLSGLFLLLLSSTAALAQAPTAPPIAASEPETVYSDAQRDHDETLSRRAIQGVLAPADGTDAQYARWKAPVCFNVYGLAPLAKYMVEKRLKDIAAQVGAPLDRAENCAPTVLIAFTADPKETLNSIAKVRPWLVPGLGMIRSSTREALPIQPWYATGLKGRSGNTVLVYSGYDEEPQIVSVAGLSRLSTGIESEIMAATIVVDTKMILGMSLETLTDHLALISLSQSRVTTRCQDFDTIANLMKSCDPAYMPSAITNTDLALLTGLYKTSDARMQLLQKQLITGAMRRTLEAKLTGKDVPLK